MRTRVYPVVRADQLEEISESTFESITIGQLNNISCNVLKMISKNKINIIENNMRYFNKRNVPLNFSFAFIPPLLTGSSFKLMNCFDDKNKKILLGVLVGAACGSYVIHRYRTSNIRKAISERSGSD